MKKNLKDLKPLSEQVVNDKTVKKSTKKTSTRSTGEDTMKYNVLFKKLNEVAVIPTFAHEGDAAMDLTAISWEYDEENGAYIYHTGLACETDKNICALILPRSSNKKTDVYLPNSAGLIDTYTYRGELLVVYKSRDDIYNDIYADAMHYYLSMPWYKRIFVSYDDVLSECFEDLEAYVKAGCPYEVGDRIAQIKFILNPELNIKEVDELSETERGEGGFGSTGK